MNFVFETQDAEQHLDLDMQVPELGSHIDWQFDDTREESIQKGMYRVERVTWEMREFITVRVFMNSTS